MEIKEENPSRSGLIFRERTLQTMEEDLGTVIEEGRLGGTGIGKALTEKIETLFTS